jgi:hypothetical protein
VNIGYEIKKMYAHLVQSLSSPLAHFKPGTPPSFEHEFQTSHSSKIILSVIHVRCPSQGSEWVGRAPAGLAQDGFAALKRSRT